MCILDVPKGREIPPLSDADAAALGGTSKSAFSIRQKALRQ